MRIGILGFGFMGGVHLAAIEQLKDATFTALSTRIRPIPGAPPKGNLAHVKSGTLPDDFNWYPDWRQLLLDPNVDAVDICLPTKLHKPAILAAFEQGKHVLCEKPMALTPAECDEILEAASKSDRTFMVAHVLRFSFPYNYAAEFVSSNRDSVTACTFQRKTGYPQWSDWLSHRESSGGAILDLLIHDIDQALRIFGRPGSLSALSDGEIDTMRSTLRYDNGMQVHINGGWYNPEMQFSAGFEITARDATLGLDSGKLSLNEAGGEKIVAIPEQDEYLAQMSYFVDCCKNNKIPELCPPAESAEAVRLATLLRASRDENGKELSCAR
jgi:predicted dehydrogenase